ncbi:MAG TPA: hypothetical protein PK788_11790, partial [Gemmatimonadaceae bacterium]|nr:hypothetical protein [Gemmatimonadaceae bacterium]
MSRLHRTILDPVSGLSDFYGAGVPASDLSAPVGSTYRRSDGVAGDTMYQRTASGWERLSAGSAAITGALTNGKLVVATGVNTIGDSALTQYAGPDQVRSANPFHPETDGVALGDSANSRRWAVAATTITTSGAITAGGQVLAPSGSAGAPGLSFSTDSNSGFYRIGENIIGVANAAVERARWDASGNFLLGGSSTTTAPTLNRGIYVLSPTDGHIIGYSLYVNEGVNNRRASFFLDDTNGLFGLQSSASTGTPSFTLRVGGTEQIRAGITTVTFYQPVTVDTTLAITGATTAAGITASGNITSTSSTSFVSQPADGAASVLTAFASTLRAGTTGTNLSASRIFNSVDNDSGDNNRYAIFRHLLQANYTSDATFEALSFEVYGDNHWEAQRRGAWVITTASTLYFTVGVGEPSSANGHFADTATAVATLSAAGNLSLDGSVSAASGANIEGVIGLRPSGGTTYNGQLAVAANNRTTYLTSNLAYVGSGTVASRLNWTYTSAAGEGAMLHLDGDASDRGVGLYLYTVPTSAGVGTNPASMTLAFGVGASGEITAGTYNGQTISSAASFTGSVSVSGVLTPSGGIAGLSTLTTTGGIFVATSGSPAVSEFYNTVKVMRNATQYIQLESDGSRYSTATGITGYSAAGNAKPLIIESTTDNANSAVTSGAVGLDFRVMGSSAAYINGARDFGIGTASPTAKLHVVGTGLFTGALTTNSTLTALGGITASGNVSFTTTTAYGSIGGGLSSNVKWYVRGTSGGSS